MPKNNQTEKATADSPAAHGSAFEVRVMALMTTERYTTARNLADQLWTKKRNGLGHRNGQWQKMGAVLRKLESKNLVTHRVTDHGQNEWRLRVQTPNAALSGAKEKYE